MARSSATLLVDAGSRPRMRQYRGFAVLKAQGRAAEISASARRGGQTAQARAADPSTPRKAHRFTPEEARAAGQKGHASRRARAEQQQQQHTTAAA